MDKLIGLAGRRSEEARAAWQQLRDHCDEAIRKLSLLKQYRERYRDLLDAALKQGMPAPAMLTHLDFIKQIEEVVVRQESDIGSLETACARRWQEVIDARREHRMYEMASARAAARETQAALRRGQARLDELLQRAAQLDEIRNFGK
jgi:flagellar export protein FliJ